MAEATITINLSEKDRELLQAVSTGLVDLVAVLTARAQAPTEWPQTADTSPWEGQEVQKPAEPGEGPEKPNLTPQPPGVEEPKPITLEELQAKVMAASTSGPGMRDKVRDIVKSYADNVRVIPEEKRAEVIAKLEALK